MLTNQMLKVLINGSYLMAAKASQVLMGHGYILMKILFCRIMWSLKLIKLYLVAKSYNNEY